MELGGWHRKNRAAQKRDVLTVTMGGRALLYKLFTHLEKNKNWRVR